MTIMTTQKMGSGTRVIAAPERSCEMTKASRKNGVNTSKRPIQGRLLVSPLPKTTP